MRTYKLDDEAGVLRGRHVYEYDLVWEEAPADLKEIVVGFLTDAVRQGADVAWFGFEGSFDFEYLIHRDIASQIYAVAVGEAVELALNDEYRQSDMWGQLLEELRDRVL